MKIKKARLDKNLTLRQVAERAGVSESMVCLIEQEKRRPSVEVAKKLAAVLCIDWTLFFA